MKQLKFALLIGMIAIAAPTRSWAQQASKDTSKRNASIPSDARPPKGMCRIWIDGVPAAQQPAATDCPTALKNRPANARVIFGDDFADSTKAKDGETTRMPPNAKGFSGVKPVTITLPKRPPQE
ncbi:MAG TPA: hypothetical protein VN706_17465 [Gemmatimonadaceae bacterium]|nr:hypothetical protein [Gemmatimonadaceae bacterium]